MKQSEREREKDTLRLTVQLLLQARAMAIRRLKEEEDGSSERMMKGVWVVLLDERKETGHGDVPCSFYRAMQPL